MDNDIGPLPYSKADEACVVRHKRNEVCGDDFQLMFIYAKVFEGSGPSINEPQQLALA